MLGGCAQHVWCAPVVVVYSQSVGKVPSGCLKVILSKFGGYPQTVCRILISYFGAPVLFGGTYSVFGVYPQHVWRVLIVCLGVPTACLEGTRSMLKEYPQCVRGLREGFVWVFYGSIQGFWVVFAAFLGCYSKGFRRSLRHVPGLPAALLGSPRSVFFEVRQLLVGVRIAFEITTMLFGDPRSVFLGSPKFVLMSPHGVPKGQRNLFLNFRSVFAGFMQTP